MFKKLLDTVQSRLQGNAPTHPLGSARGVADVVGSISHTDPSHALIDIDEWLTGLEAALPEIGMAAVPDAVIALDECARPNRDELLQRFLTPGSREYHTEFVWNTLEAHAGRVIAGFRLALDALSAPPEATADKERFAMAGARCLRLWAMRKKLQRLRYRAPADALWNDAHSMVRQLARLGLIQARIVAYPGERETSPLREYLAGVYLELAPLGNLLPQQLEFVDRFLQTAESFEFVAEQLDSTTHAVDFSIAKPPWRCGREQPGGPSIRFLGTVRLRGLLMRLAGQIKRAESIPEWVAEAPLETEELDAAIMALALHWAPTPPKRNAQRQASNGNVLAVFGLVLARRMIAAAQFVRSGNAWKYETVDYDKLFEENRFGRLPSEEERKAAETLRAKPKQEKSPLDILRSMELRGEKAQMESWTLVDSSATGFGATIPAVLPRHRIGALIAVREENGLEWKLGLVRRIGRDSKNRPNIGIESLPGLPLCASAKSVDNIGRWADIANAGLGGVDALLLSEDSTQMLLPVDAFLEDIAVELKIENKHSRIRLTKLVERGPDFDRVEFEYEPQDGTPKEPA